MESEEKRKTFLPITDLVGQLQIGLGERLTALIADEKNVSLVDAWAHGKVELNRETKFRLRLANLIIRRMTIPSEGQMPEAIETVRSWFIGTDPFLDERAPALVIADMKLGDTKGISRILRATDIFLAE